MTPVAVFFLALSMSVDAFAVSVGRGASLLVRPRVSEAIRTGAVFGITEGIMPLIGWAIGAAASHFVAAYDHWIAFAILAGVGLHMAVTALRNPATEEAPSPAQVCKTGSAFRRIGCLVLTAVGTSIDSMAVGASLAFFRVNIGIIALSIGTATFLMSSAGMLIGRHLGSRCGRPATIIAGLVLIALGVVILWPHIG